MPVNKLLGYGRDFAQGASNAAASNVSGPVDAIAWLLRKAGIDVGEPVGGSDWMARQGLTARPQNELAGLLGEAAGMSAPIGAIAKAPQIAAGLNQLAANAAAPTSALNAQRGAVVWHGSPHKFDAFDSSKIGTGEGAQAYGHGLYLAEHPTTAATYANMRAAPNMEFHTASGRKLLGLEKSIADDITTNGIGIAERNARANGPEWLDAFERIKAETITRGNLYKVDLPDEQIARMLDWDKPLSQQAPEVQAAAAKIWGDIPEWKANAGYVERVGDAVSGFRKAPIEQMTGEQFFKSLQRGADSHSSSLLSDDMRKLGIPGIRYLDGGSRGAGTGTSNYVVFPGEENALRILERNSQAIK